MIPTPSGENKHARALASRRERGGCEFDERGAPAIRSGLERRAGRATAGAGTTALRNGPPVRVSYPVRTRPLAEESRPRPEAAPILVLAGFNLTLIQYVLLRELAALLGSNEIVAVLVAVAYFMGLALGYLVSDRLGRRALLGLALGTLALHLTMPFLPRYVAGALAGIDLLGAVPPFVFALVNRPRWSGLAIPSYRACAPGGRHFFRTQYWFRFPPFSGLSRTSCGTPSA